MERSDRFIRTNLEPGRRFANRLDFQAQLDAWCDRANARVHRTIRAVTSDIAEFHFNTMLARLMEFVNELYPLRSRDVSRTAAWHEALQTLTLLLAPAAPYLAEELWERLGGAYSVHQQPWPGWNPELAAEEQIEIVVQVNGKVRDRLMVPAEIAEEQVVAMAKASDRVREYFDGKTIRRIIYVPGRLLNIVVG